MRKILINIAILFFISNCNEKAKDVMLDKQDIVNSERIIITDKNFIIQKNLLFGTEHYDSYLFFYTRDLKFQCSEPCPGLIFAIYNDSLVGGYNPYKFGSVSKKLNNGVLINFSRKTPDIQFEKYDTLHSIRLDKDSIVFNNKKHHINEIELSSFYQKQIDNYTLSNDTLFSIGYIINKEQRKLIYGLIWSEIILKNKKK